VLETQTKFLEHKMKITKRQLRRIIKEEKQKLLKEYGIRRPMTTEADALEFALDEYIKARVTIGENNQQRIQDEIQAIIDQLWNDVGMQYGEIDRTRYQ
jgi:hypothetical protein